MPLKGEAAASQPPQDTLMSVSKSEISSTSDRGGGTKEGAVKRGRDERGEGREWRGGGRKAVKAGRGGEISPPRSFLKVGAYEPNKVDICTSVACNVQNIT